MNQKLIDSLTRHVLYEGHFLHPSRRDVRSAPRPNALGRIKPRFALTGTDDPLPGAVQTQCLVEGFPSARVTVAVRFLHALERDIGELSVPMATLPPPNYSDFFHVVPEIVVDNTPFASRAEAVERTIALAPFTLEELLAEAREVPFQFPASRTIESIRGPDGMIVGVIVRRQEAVRGTLEVNAEPVDLTLTKLSVRVTNATPEPSAGFGDEEDVALRTFACVHQVLQVQDGQFLSMVEPPETRAVAIAGCRNIGTYPVLIGEAAAERDTLLSSAVFVEDYPTLTLFAPSEASAELEEALT